MAVYEEESKSVASALWGYVHLCNLVLHIFQIQQGVEAAGLLENVKSWVLASIYGSGTFTHFWK